MPLHFRSTHLTMHSRVNKHDQHGTARWFTFVAGRAPHCRRTVACARRPRTPPDWHPNTRPSSRVHLLRLDHTDTTNTILRFSHTKTIALEKKIYFGLWNWLNATEQIATGGSKTDDTISFLRSDPYRLKSNSRAANKIITNVHEMLVKLRARGLRHRIELTYNY